MKTVKFLATFFLFSVLIVCLISSAVTGEADQQSKLVVYTYDTFQTYGPASLIEKKFEEKYDVDVQFVATADSRQMLARLIREKRDGNTPADVFIGVEKSDSNKVIANDLFQSVDGAKIPHLEKIPRQIRFDPQRRMIPYEYGYITLIYDSQKLPTDQVPQTFEELTKPRYRNSLILQDPRLSSPGYSFLLWTIYNYGDRYLDYWKRLLPNVLTITGGWGEAFELFTSGEAPMMVSFSTDTAYSVIEHNSTRYRVLLLDNQGYINVYTMGIVSGTDDPGMSHKLLDLVLSPQIQEQIPTTEWMFPVNPDAKLPVRFYQFAVKPPLEISLSAERIAKNSDRWLKEWAREVK